jgi:hypothetical protein
LCDISVVLVLLRDFYASIGQENPEITLDVGE